MDRNTSGMGLGLADRQAIKVRPHRGKIWVESEPNAGSKFTFLLPMDQWEKGGNGAGIFLERERTTAMAVKDKILVVDDTYRRPEVSANVAGGR